MNKRAPCEFVYTNGEDCGIPGENAVSVRSYLGEWTRWPACGEHQVVMARELRAMGFDVTRLYAAGDVDDRRRAELETERPAA